MIGIDEFVERLCTLGARPGPRRFPRSPRDREILFKSVRMVLDPVADYSEKQINQLLGRWQRRVAPEIDIDHVTLRRLLVDYGELERTRDGASYRLGFPGRPVAFELEIDELDLEATVAAYREGRERTARDRRQAVSEAEVISPPARPRPPRPRSRRTRARGSRSRG